MANLSHSEIFRTLKPACVRLNHAALSIRSGSSAANDVTLAAENLFQVLAHLEKVGEDINERQVNYAFFPLSHMFRDRTKFPTRSLELGLQCLKIFLRTGWRVISEPTTGIQLLILLTFLVEEKISEEVSTVSMTCISSLFRSIKESSACKDELFRTINLPVAGHSLSVILDNMKQSDSGTLQISSVEALHLFCTVIATPKVMQNFSPGVFSILSTVLTPSTKARRPYKLLQSAMEILQYLILLLFSGRDELGAQNVTNKGEKTHDVSWSKNAAAQTKLVLANVVRLRNHDRVEVRDALLDLCWTILEDCSAILFDSVPMILDITIALSSKEEDEKDLLRLQRLLGQTGFEEHAKKALHESLLSLPRLSLSTSDDSMRQLTLQIASWIRMLDSSDLEKSALDGLFQEALRDSLLNIFGSSKGLDMIETSRLLPEVGDDASNLFNHPDGSLEILPIETHTRLSLVHLRKLISVMSKGEGALNFATRALERAYDGTEDMRFVDLWVCCQVLRSMADTRQISQVDLGGFVLEDEENELCDDLFSLAVSLLTHLDASGSADLRLHTVALEIVIFQAERHGRHFRPELIDALYPIVYLLGSSTSLLRNYATTGLNKIALACGYTDVKDMMIANADYLVNSVGLRLAALDVSPQSCKVLLAMIKLCGPTLLPYLGDLFENIFDALECFHGYTELVEELFRVLQAAVGEGTKTLKSGVDALSAHRKDRRLLQDIRGIIDCLNKAQTLDVEQDLDQAPIDPLDLPSALQENDIDDIRISNQEMQTPTTLESNTDISRQNIKERTEIFELLTRIASLTQYHLPLSSPTLRAELLALLDHVIPFLSRDEDRFLPLVHTLWPVLVRRLLDKEAFVVARVLTVLASICRAAGDFLSGHIDDLWPTIRKLCSLEQDAVMNTTNHSFHIVSEKPSSVVAWRSRYEEEQLKERSSLQALNPKTKTSGGSVPYSESIISHDPRRTTLIHDGYSSTTRQLIRKALMHFLTELISHVRTSAEVYLEALTMIMSFRLPDEEAPARAALGQINVDAVSLFLAMGYHNFYRDNTTATKLSWEAIRYPSDVAGGPAFCTNL